MAVVVQFSVTPADPERLIDAFKRFAEATAGAGVRHRRIYRLGSDPSRFCTLEEYDSPEHAHRVSDELGAEFNREAGTESAEWEAKVWIPLEL